MNNEIKEILDYLGNDNIEKPFGMATIDKHKLLDYITNLQQENERLKRKLTTKKLFKKYKVEKDENLELRKIFELQRRIEKAVEELELWQPKIESLKLEKEYLLDILNGDKSE